MTKETTTSSLLKKHFRLLIEDVVVPARVIVATSLVFVLFLVADQAIFYIIYLTSSDIKSRAHVGLKVKGIMIARSKSSVTRFALDIHSNTAT